MEYDVFFFEAFEEEAEALRAALPAGVSAGLTWKTIQEYGAETPPARLISVRTQSDIPVKWAGVLAGILSRSTGYDHLARYREAVGNAEFPCGYLPLYCNRAVAEQACMMWMALLRGLPRQVRQFENFKRDGLTGFECAGRTLAVFGVGNIGYQAVRIGRGLDMNVVGVDLIHKYEDVEYCTPEEALRQADVVVCAMNLTAENPGYFTLDRLLMTRPGCIFVNIARGELAPSRVVLEAVERGHLGGVGMDVYNHEIELAGALRDGVATDNEEVQATLKLKECPNVVMTPHNAFNTQGAVVRKSEHSAQQIENFLRAGAFLWPIP
jgi:D-lactate dehydrogenase